MATRPPRGTSRRTTTGGTRQQESQKESIRSSISQNLNQTLNQLMFKYSRTNYCRCFPLQKTSSVTEGRHPPTILMYIPRMQ